jgi:transcriptional regulator with XRE-family HTH domain
MLRIQQICKEKGISMQELASRLNIHYQSLYDSLKGNPTLKRLTDVANALGVDIVELFVEKGDFVAFVRRQGETFTFDSEKALIDYAEGLKVNK